MDPRKIKWAKDSIRKNFSFLLILIITSMFSIISLNILQIAPTDANQMTNFLILKILYASVVLIIAAIALVLLFAKHFIRDLDKLSLHECVPKDITTVNSEKHVEIGLDAEENGCKITEIREIQNHMPHDYNRYLFSHRLSHAPPTFDKYKFYVDDEKTPKNYSVEDLNYEVNESPSRDPNILKYRVEYKFPIQVRSHENKKIRVEFPSNSITDALGGKLDWIEYDVNSIIEKFKIEIKLVDGKQKDYYLDHPSHPKNDDGAKYDIEIRDYSRQRMWNSEISLKNENILPKFSGLFSADTLTWVVYHPKIGYKYRVYFTVKKKVDTPTSKQMSLSDE